MKSAKVIELPFQYGYGDHFVDMAGRALMKWGLIEKDHQTALWRYCEDHNIILRTSKQEGCRKKDLIQA